MLDTNTTLVGLHTILYFEPDETSRTFSLWSLQDAITEGIECLFFTLEPVDEFVVISDDNNTVTICIEDDDSEFQ